MKMSWPLALGAGSAAALGAYLLGRTDPVQRTLAKVIPSRGKLSGGRPLVGFTVQKVPWKKNRAGVMMLREEVAESPAALALKASEVAGRREVIPLTTFALATLMASEAGDGPELARAAIGHAALTMAAKKKVDVKKLLMPDGKFGGQQGRYASTVKPPSLVDVELADGVLSGALANPAPGSDQWDSPRAQNALFARGEAGYKGGAEYLAAQRIAEGKREITLPGVDPGYLRLWRPV